MSAHAVYPGSSHQVLSTQVPGSGAVLFHFMSVLMVNAGCSPLLAPTAPGIRLWSHFKIHLWMVWLVNASSRGKNHNMLSLEWVSEVISWHLLNPLCVRNMTSQVGKYIAQGHIQRSGDWVLRLAQGSSYFQAVSSHRADSHLPSHTDVSRPTNEPTS